MAYKPGARPWDTRLTAHWGHIYALLAGCLPLGHAAYSASSILFVYVCYYMRPMASGSPHHIYTATFTAPIYYKLTTITNQPWVVHRCIHIQRRFTKTCVHMQQEFTNKRAMSSKSTSVHIQQGFTYRCNKSPQMESWVPSSHLAWVQPKRCNQLPPQHVCPPLMTSTMQSYKFQIEAK